MCVFEEGQCKWRNSNSRKYSDKSTAKATGVPQRAIRRDFNKWVFQEIPSTSVYTPDGNRS